MARVGQVIISKRVEHLLGLSSCKEGMLLSETLSGVTQLNIGDIFLLVYMYGFLLLFFLFCFLFLFNILVL